MNTLRRIERVDAVAPCSLSIKWRDGATDFVDMTGIVYGLKPFAPLREFDLFRTVTTVDWGSGVEWSNGLDYSSDSLVALAEEQRNMAGADFTAWQKKMGLSIRETADLFGVAPSTVKDYRKAKALPIAWQIACRAMADDRETFLAHYRPRIVGRPRRKTAETLEQS